MGNVLSFEPSFTIIISKFLYKNYQYDMIKADKFGYLEKWPKEVEKNDYEYITLSDLI